MRYKNGVRANPIIRVSVPETIPFRKVSDFITSMNVDTENRTFSIQVLDKESAVITGRYYAIMNGCSFWLTNVDALDSNQSTQVGLLLNDRRTDFDGFISQVFESLINQELILVSGIEA